MMIPFRGKMPQDCGAAFVAPNATVLGDVVLEKGSGVWSGNGVRQSRRRPGGGGMGVADSNGQCVRHVVGLRRFF